MAQLVFVTTDASAQIPSSQRGLIRSHCMRQKNKQPGSRRSKREARRMLAATKQREESEAPSFTSSAAAAAAAAAAASESARCLVQVPPPPPSDWALYRFPAEMDYTSRTMFQRYFTCNPIRDPVFPFKLFGIKVDVHTDALWYSVMLLQDQLFFRAWDVMMSSSNDLIYGPNLSNWSRRKLQELLPLLNQRLSQPNSHMEGIVLYVVGLLASMAVLFKDFASASLHAKGISEILRLRGSSKSDPADVMLLMALDRLSFSSSILTDQWTPIHFGAVRESPAFPDEVLLLYEVQEMLPPDFVSDKRLALVFHTLQCTTVLLDTHDFGAPCVNGARLHEGMGFVQSELLELKGKLADGLSKCIRLALMAFLATTFRVPGQFEHPCCASLAEPLLSAYIAGRKRIMALPDALQTWLLLMGVMTAGGVTDEPLRASWRHMSTLHQNCWDGVKHQARRVMWIDAIHDPLGRRAFDTLRLESRDVV